ncbi:MAG TPA: outer membrane beta-barrel protein [Flavitalea sp.]|nr:outer membrane beta-barrel protein [Flavitalea sp.]
MSDHNFEAQIQQKLDELRILPADKVWSSVEAQIQKDRRRRRGVIFFPALLLLIGAGFYFIFQNYLSSTNNSVSKSTSTNFTSDNNNNDNRSRIEKAKKGQELNKQQPIQENVVNEIKQPDIRNLQDQQASDQNQLDSKANQQPDVNNPVPGKIAQTSPEIASTKSTKGKNVVALKKNSRRNITKNYANTGKGVSQEVIRNNEVTDRNVSSEKKIGSVDSKPVQELIVTDKKSTLVTDSVARNVADSGEKSMSDSTKKHIEIAQTASVDSISAVAILGDKKAASKKLRSSWKWGVTASAGISNLNEGGFFDGIFGGILGVEKALVADVSPGSVNNSQSNAGPSAVVYKPSEIEKGFSYSIGAFIQKSITKKISISTGLQYRYYSNHIRVGNRIDSFAMVQNAFGSMNISQYYRSAPVPTTEKYTNRFHFVELPVEGHLQLNKGNRLPISWVAGLSLSYLVSTNALHFDSRTGLYYRDNDLLNKLQLSMSTGFSFTLWNTSRLSVQLGPHLQYGFTDLMKQKLSDSRHLFYFGLNSRVFLKK